MPIHTPVRNRKANFLSFIQVVAGEYDRSVNEGSEQKVGVSQVIIHPNYDSSTYQNDIALLKLKHGLTFNEFVQPIQMPPTNAVLSGSCMVAGWGANVELGNPVNIPRKVYLPIWSDEQCRGVYSVEEVHETMVCAGYEEGGKDSCHTDSGGPLTCYNDNTHFLGGVVSWGYGCARANCPGVYTELVHFLPWIKASDV